MNKILHISKYYHPFVGGTEQVARDCVNVFKGSYEQKVICFNHEKGNITDKVDDVEVIRVNCQAKVASQSIALSYGKQLKKTINSFKPDIVIFHYPNPFVAHSLLKFRKKKSFKLITWWHLDITKQKILGKLFNGQSEKLLKMSDKVVATSPNYIDGSPFLSKYRDKCVIIPNCVSEAMLEYNAKHLELAKQFKEKYKDKKICFAFGRHVPYKGLIYLINASKYLDDSYAILIGGKGPLTESLQKEAQGDNKISFLGRIDDEELKGILLACDVFCFPSITKNEAFGIGQAEAMYYGNAIVNFYIEGSGVNYVSLNGITGIEVENGNSEKFAEAIKEIANNPELKEKYKENSKKRVEELFTYSTFKNNVEKLLKEI